MCENMKQEVAAETKGYAQQEDPQLCDLKEQTARLRIVHLCEEVSMEAQRAKLLFPQSAALMTAMVEEVGEVAKALLSEDWDAVRKECIQVGATAVRLALEGDSTLRYFRRNKALDGGPNE